MGCETLAEGVVICRPPRGVVRRRYLRCWNCQTVRRCVQIFTGIWYPDEFWCCHCGDGWGDGQRMERPFQRGWRQKSITNAQRYWRTALRPAEFKAAWQADMRRNFGED
jgi:hypothetical protein